MTPARNGFGRAVIHGLDHLNGDAAVIMMADQSDEFARCFAFSSDLRILARTRFLCNIKKKALAVGSIFCLRDRGSLACSADSYADGQAPSF